MLLLYAFILIAALWGLRRRAAGDGDAALLPDQTTALKGIFVLLVFASHLEPFLKLYASEGFLTQGYLFLRARLGQLVVVPFLFCSGYGISCAIERKGAPYLRAFPKNRLLKTYVHTALILLLFWGTQALLGQFFPPGQCAAAFLLWGSFGNSNWYLFAVLFLYLFTWISFRLFQNRPRVAICFCFGLTLGYFLVLLRYKEAWWYNTVFAYCFGLLYPALRQKLSHLWEKSAGWLAFPAGSAGLVLALTFLRFEPLADGFRENLRAIAFILLLNCFLYRVQLGNRMLRWLGSHVFECYLLQRLPMLVLSYFGLGARSRALFVLACAAGTVLLVIPVSLGLRLVDRRLFPAPQNPNT
jgi:hypothetical protein